MGLEDQGLVGSLETDGQKVTPFAQKEPLNAADCPLTFPTMSQQTTGQCLPFACFRHLAQLTHNRLEYSIYQQR